MAETSITNLPNATTPLSGAERVPMDQAGVTVDATSQAIADLSAPAIAAAVTTHEGAADPHPDYALESSLGSAALLNVGTTAGTVAAGDDSRLSDSRTPTAHKASHATGGGDALTPADIGAATVAQGGLADSAVQPGDLATVATTGAYADLSGLPTLGTAAAAATTDFAPAAQGVTNGNSHNHDGGDGAQIAYSSLSGLPTLGTAAALNVGTSAGNVVQLDGSSRLPAVDGSQLTGLPPGTTDLSYNASTRLLSSSTGADVTLPLFSSTEAGLTPLSGGGTTNFLRADGTWATPSGGGGSNAFAVIAGMIF